MGEDHKGRYNFAELRAIVGIHANLRPDEPHKVTFKCFNDQDLGMITTEEPHGFSDDTIVTFTDVSHSKPAKSSKLKKDTEFYYVKPCQQVHGRSDRYTFKLYRSEERDDRDVITFKDGELTQGAFQVQERDEIKIMHGVMKLTHMTAADGVLSLTEVAMLEQGELLTKEKLQEILHWGHSRLPVFMGNKHNIRGFILAKKLIVVSPDDGKKVEKADIQKMVVVPPDMGMLDLLNQFQSERCHIAIVTSHPSKVRRAWEEDRPIPPDVHMMGIITLEDIIEKLIQEDIYDEYDGDISSPVEREGRMRAPSGGIRMGLYESPKRCISETLPRESRAYSEGGKTRHSARFLIPPKQNPLAEPLLQKMEPVPSLDT